MHSLHLQCLSASSSGLPAVLLGKGHVSQERGVNSLKICIFVTVVLGVIPVPFWGLVGCGVVFGLGCIC